MVLRLVSEGEAQHETDAERSENRFHRIFAHVILTLFLRGANAHFRLIPRLLGLVSIIFRHLGS